MNDVLNYIFKNIDVTEKTLSVLNVAMKKQTRFNKVFFDVRGIIVGDFCKAGCNFKGTVSED